MIELSLMKRIFNVSPGEVKRIALCFGIRFFHRFGFVVGWTVITALIVSNYGIEYLPYLFLGNGLFIIASGTVYSKLVTRLQNTPLILWTVGTAAFMIILGTFLTSQILSLLLLTILFAESFLLYQLNILLSAFIERFFTPLTCQRAFPLIESAETLAILCAGLLMMFVSPYLSPRGFFYIWALAVLLMVPFILYAGKLSTSTEIFEVVSTKRSGFLSILVNDINNARKNRFLGALVFIVLFQWIFLSLMEFQYTKTVSVSVFSEFDVPQSTSSNEHALVHALGSLQILFGSSALLMQVLVGSRIISSLGIISSMLLFPIVAFLSVFGLTVNFSYLTGVLAKNNTEMSNVLFKNAYHSAFYAFPDSTREVSREFLEGFVRPFAAIVAMSLILGLQFMFRGPILSLATNIALFVTALSMMIYVLIARRRYTEASASSIFNPKSFLHDKFHAVEVLAQKGHFHVFKIFAKALKSELVPDSVKDKIVEILSHDDKHKLLSLISKDDELISQRVTQLLNNLSKHDE